MEIKNYHIRLSARGIFPELRCNQICEEYNFNFSSLNNALDFAKAMNKVFKRKAGLLGNVDKFDEVYVCQQEKGITDQPMFVYGV